MKRRFTREEKSIPCVETSCFGVWQTQHKNMEGSGFYGKTDGWIISVSFVVLAPYGLFNVREVSLLCRVMQKHRLNKIPYLNCNKIKNLSSNPKNALPYIHQVGHHSMHI